MQREMLRRVLRAYCCSRPAGRGRSCAYCQGMNFVAAVCIAALPVEEGAVAHEQETGVFWSFVTLLDHCGLRCLFQAEGHAHSPPFAPPTLRCRCRPPARRPRTPAGQGRSPCSLRLLCPPARVTGRTSLHTCTTSKR